MAQLMETPEPRQVQALHKRTVAAWIDSSSSARRRHPAEGDTMANEFEVAGGERQHETVRHRSGTVINYVATRLCLAHLLLLSCMSVAAFAQSDDGRDPAAKIVEDEIGRFAGEFADLEFVWLSGRAFSVNMLKLSAALGAEHELLDYEHHPHQVKALNALNLNRIKMMLVTDSPSSSLYRVRNNETHGKPYVVVITLNPDALAPDTRSSTCSMYGINFSEYGSVSEHNRVNNSVYLRYIVRHEIAHALKAYLFGGHAFTQKPLGGEYNSLLSEIWADMFAVMMEQRTDVEGVSFARKLVDARTVALVTEFDVQHFTSPQVKGVLRTNVADISSLRQLAALVQAEYEKAMPTYDDFAVLRTAAYHLRYALGNSPYHPLMQDEVVAEYEVELPHEGLLAELVQDAEAAMNRVFR
jgi:hypothetical protein